MNTLNIKDFKLGEVVECNGQIDVIIDFITPENDKENFDLGYELLLKENGTQTIGCVKKLN